MLVYSRDAMSHPLRLLIDVIDSVANGAFDPDLTRSGLFAREAGGMADDLGDESSSCGSEDDLDVFAEEKAIEHVSADWQPVSKDSEEAVVYVRHATSRCIHRLMDEGGTHLGCGRVMSSRYEVQSCKPNFFHPLCGTCFKDH